MALKLYKKRKNSKLGLITILIFLSLSVSFFFIIYLSKKINPIFMSYAESETRKLMTLVINKSLTKELTLKDEIDNIYHITKSNNEDIQIIDFDSKEVTKFLNNITNLIQNNLKAIEEGNIDLIDLEENTLDKYDKYLLKKGIIYEIPIFAATNSSLLSNIGPRIPVRFYLIGDVTSNVETEVKEYGINNALVKLSIRINVSGRVNLPFVSENVTVDMVIPVSMKIIQGKIPEFYLDGFKSTSNLVESTS